MRGKIWALLPVKEQKVQLLSPKNSRNLGFTFNVIKTDGAFYNIFVFLSKPTYRSRMDSPRYYRLAHLLWERDMLTPNLKLRLAVNLSCDLGQ